MLLISRLSLVSLSLSLSLVNFEYLFFTELHTIRNFLIFISLEKLRSTIYRRGQPSESNGEDLVDRKSMDVAFPEGYRPTSPD